ncbi:MAG: formate/nitrite transporter family protein [Eubacteriales bacterium]|nr:formate/nitrite transporter family protein [Eubacteriales bacterium]MDD4717634.1 formate/nitrite transporter family protein [Eubacteriales bacterium]
MNDPVATTELLIQSGVRKSTSPVAKTFLLGIIAGAFIAFASAASNVAIHTIPSVGLAKTLAGALFAAGLMMVVFFGAELFTGNMLMSIAMFRGAARPMAVLKNWVIVYVGNFAGSILIAFLVVISGQLDFSGGDLGAFTLKTAAYKADLGFVEGLSLGILCNWLVCMAVWMAASAKSAAGKIAGIFFPIWLFITSGFEHSVANMYYIPAGLFIKGNAEYYAGALTLGASAGSLEGLNWSSFLFGNLLPVTLGNMIGGIVFVGAAALLAFGRRSEGTGV